jgi:predicted transcriptional regulator
VCISIRSTGDHHVDSCEVIAGWEQMDNIADSMHVSQLVPLDQKIVSISYAGRVSEAMELMQIHAFNQLPVEADDGSILGLFSYRSFAKHVGNFRPSDDILSKKVADLIDEPYFSRPTENLSGVIEPKSVQPT